MNRNLISSLGIWSAAVLTAGCLGGGGGGSAPPPPAAMTLGFPGFGNAPANSSFDLEGDFRTGQISIDAGGDAALSVAREGGLQATVEFDGAGAWDALTIPSARTPLDVDAGDGDAVSRVGSTIRFSDANGRDEGLFREAVITDGGLTPNVERLEHMSFGIWATEASPNLIRIGAGAFGSPTDPGRLRGMAAYDGEVVGYYVNPSAEAFATVARLTADLDFDAGDFTAVTRDSVRISTSGTNTADPRLNMFMNGTINGRTFSGTAVATSGRMTGDFTGGVYGPDGREMGGTFDMQGVDGRHAGAFGARAR